MGIVSDIQTKVNDFVTDLFNEFIVDHFDDSVEMKASIDVANNIGDEIALIDRDVQIPISKFLFDLGWIKSIKLILRLDSSYDEFGLSFETFENLFKEFSPSLFNEHFVKRRTAFITCGKCSCSS
ncbi:MAG: hypothetical protein FWH29_02395 [Methanobrevibacter sp.]|nr:hypothetical protein [Methanobrevibacter sp.]